MMGIFRGKKKVEEKEPEYYLSATNIPTINYKVIVPQKARKYKQI